MEAAQERSERGWGSLERQDEGPCGSRHMTQWEEHLASAGAQWHCKSRGVLTGTCVTSAEAWVCSEQHPQHPTAGPGQVCSEFPVPARPPDPHLLVLLAAEGRATRPQLCHSREQTGEDREHGGPGVGASQARGKQLCRSHSPPAHPGGPDSPGVSRVGSVGYSGLPWRPAVVWAR